MNPFMSRRKLNPDLFPAINLTIELFQEAGILMNYGLNATGMHWHTAWSTDHVTKSEACKVLYLPSLPQIIEYVKLHPSLLTAGSFRMEPRCGFTTQMNHPNPQGATNRDSSPPACSYLLLQASTLLWAHSGQTQRTKLLQRIILWQGQFSPSFAPWTSLRWLPTPNASTRSCRNTQLMW